MIKKYYYIKQNYFREKLSHENFPTGRLKWEKTFKDIPSKLLWSLNIVYAHNSPQQMLVAYLTFIFKLLYSLQGILPLLFLLIPLTYTFVTILVDRHYYFHSKYVETKPQED